MEVLRELVEMFLRENAAVAQCTRTRTALLSLPPAAVLYRPQQHVAHLERERPFRHSEEAFGRIGQRDLQAAQVLFGRGELLFLQEIAHGEGAVLRGVDELDLRANELL